MTQDKDYGLLYQAYAFSSPELKKHEDLLVHTINRGYNAPRFQFNVITSPRIKHSVVEDLCVVPEESSYALFCFADPRAGASSTDRTSTVKIDVDELVDDAAAAREKLLQLYPKGTIDTQNPRILYDDSVSPKKGTTEKLCLPAPDNQFTSRFLGMACLKPRGGSGTSYELTGFISFYPGVGTHLIRTVEQFARSQLAATDIWIAAIEEHLLGQMYSKFGYEFVERVLIPVSADSGGKVADTQDHLENDIMASRDFHLEVLCKKLT
ncbi:hypothetical protein PICMEDRAFT_11696 [Pichia membranifaciens NRRL Y-2026]|uniref:Uncharacterized protein n=1 Tax=Pichia membranifaciens NRRL Y-2026 TaxID=763406 RepID=A0A1E3NKS4_9ASCO|nr:hypothetical protein PICMEDRAFT_11696 [Pichia membranifaciens NRRL Y-2026]ODQ46720.1 hypothetical protein PICMEDRAFT_11696 [Pichia membranifaciens NRRL Y-2026]